MERLPAEIIAQILEAVQEPVISRKGWWRCSTSYNTFVNSFSLVCKAWHRIAIRHRNIFWLEDHVTARLLQSSIEAGTDYRITHLHIPMDALITVDDDEWALSAPAQAILRRTRGTLVSLSVPIQLFDDEAGDKCILNRVAAHVSHLRLFDGNHPELLPILSWSSAKYIHLNSKLLSLELEGVSVDDIDYQRVDEQTCHAKTIQLIAIQSFKPLHCGKLFPSARRLAVFGPLKIDTSAPLANLIHLELACIPSQSPLNLQTWGILASPNLFRLHVSALEEIVEPLGCWKCTSTLKKGDASLTYAGFFRPTDYICEACEQCWVTYECKRGETEFPGSTAASLSPCHRLTVIKDDYGVFQNLRLLREVISTWKERHKEMDNAEMASALIDALALAPGRRELPYATFVRKALGLQSDTESIGIKAEIA